MDWLQETARTPLADFVMPILSSLSDAGILWILLGLALLCFKATRRQGAVLLVALLLEFIFCNGILKPVVARLRPYDVRDIADLLVPELHDFSFPSGHTAKAAGVFLLVLLCDVYENLRGKKYIFVTAGIVWTLFIAIGRIIRAAHFASDVTSGAFFMLVSFILVRSFYDRIREKG